MSNNDACYFWLFRLKVNDYDYNYINLKLLLPLQRKCTNKEDKNDKEKN